MTDSRYVARYHEKRNDNAVQAIDDLIANGPGRVGKLLQKQTYLFEIIELGEMVELRCRCFRISGLHAPCHGVARAQGHEGAKGVPQLLQKGRPKAARGRTGGFYEPESSHLARLSLSHLTMRPRLGLGP